MFKKDKRIPLHHRPPFIRPKPKMSFLEALQLAIRPKAVRNNKPLAKKAAGIGLTAIAAVAIAGVIEKGRDAQ